MRKILANIINFVFSFTKIKDNKIVFESGRDKIEGNPYAIYSYIKENCPNDFLMYWLISKETNFSMIDKKECAFYRTFTYLYHLSTAKYIIRSQSTGSILKKRSGQIYIQTWHGALNLKKCGYDITDDKNREPMEHVKDWDYFIASDRYCAKAIRTSTGYQKPIISLGQARTDELVNFDSSRVKEIKEKLRIDTTKNKTIVLYAPTFRERNIDDQQFELPIETLKNNDQILLLIRLHPLVSKFMDEHRLGDNMINVSGYPEILDLLLISDVLVTDYSSSIFDYVLLKRPIIFYAYDFEQYMAERNGFYIDYKTDLPGPIAYNENELNDLVKNVDNIINDYSEKLNKFNEKYNYLNDGNVCERFVYELKNGTFR